MSHNRIELSKLENFISVALMFSTNLSKCGLWKIIPKDRNYKMPFLRTELSMTAKKTNVEVQVTMNLYQRLWIYLRTWLLSTKLIH